MSIDPSAAPLSDRVYQAVWGHAFALLYDRAFARAEESGLRALRSELLAQSAGVTVELGAGTGLNVSHYPATLTRLILTEPNRYMVKQLRAKAAISPMFPEVSDASAGALPFENGTVDTVISTLVLCTVSNPAAVLREAARVLRPGGHFLFIEHVRATSARLASWQDRLRLPWSWCAGGCQCNRDTLSAISQSPLNLEAVRSDRLRWMGPLLRPLVVGVATR